MLSAHLSPAGALLRQRKFSEMPIMREVLEKLEAINLDDQPPVA